ncbi:MAG: S8 family serine peptidase [Paracoccaceae bacterium]
MKKLFVFILLIKLNLAANLNANQFGFEIDKEERGLIEIFEIVCNKLLNNIKIDKLKNWELQKIKNNNIFLINSKTSQDLSIKIIKRGINNKAYRFTFKNIKGAKIFITSNSDCKVNMARIIQRNKLNQIIALVELSNNLKHIKKVELINPKVPYIYPLPLGVKIALIDTGINYTLPEITNKISRISPTEINGYDFVENDNLPYDIDFVRSPFFPRYHGTSVASVIIKEAPDASIVPYKFSRKNYCSFGEIIKKLRETTIKIALLAMGSKNKKDWQCFFKEAKKSKDILFIVTAGNNNLNIDNDKIYPASFDLENMIVVSSSTLFGDLAKGSNFGIKSVDFLVNGEQLEVIDHRGVRSLTSGSSYAAPRVAAMAARYFAINPDSNILEFKSMMIKRAIKNSNKLVKYGWIPDPLDNYLF